MNTIKYILIHIELFVLLMVFFIGTGVGDNGITWVNFVLLFGPFAYGKLTHIGKRIDFCEVYSRAWNISLKSNK